MQPPDDPIPVIQKPTRARFVVLGFLCSMAFVLYLDRVCISQALVPMQEEFELSNTQTSYVLMAFTLAYGIFEIPTGRWGDRFGSRRVLTRIVLWWSAFTALTGCVLRFSHELGVVPMPYPLSEWFEPIPLVFNSLVLLIAIRFLFGAGEAGAIPNSARILMHWFSKTERGTMQGRYQASMHVGGALAPLVAAQIIASPLGWRGTFIIFGAVGVGTYILLTAMRGSPSLNAIASIIRYPGRVAGATGEVRQVVGDVRAIADDIAGVKETIWSLFDTRDDADTGNGVGGIFAGGWDAGDASGGETIGSALGGIFDFAG